MRNSYKQYQELRYSVPTADLLLVAFVVLKLTGVIDWSWWWVLSPIWITFAFAGTIFIGVFICISLKNAIRKWKRRKK